MKNPFIKKDTSGLWIAAITVSALAAGALTWLYFKKKEVEDSADFIPLNYQHRGGRLKKHKSDVSDLHIITPAPHNEPANGAN
jgi:hypothetical protein